MHSSESVDQRLMKLEIKSSFTEDLVERLNEVIVRQQAQIDGLQRDLLALRLHLTHPGMVTAKGVQALLSPVHSP